MAKILAPNFLFFQFWPQIRSPFFAFKSHLFSQTAQFPAPRRVYGKLIPRDAIKHPTDQILHVTADTGKSTVVSLEEVNADALYVCIGLMEDVLAEKTVDLPGKTGCSVSGRESDGKFSAELHHHDYAFPLVEVDVYSPRSLKDPTQSPYPNWTAS